MRLSSPSQILFSQKCKVTSCNSEFISQYDAFCFLRNHKKRQNYDLMKFRIAGGIMRFKKLQLPFLFWRKQASVVNGATGNIIYKLSLWLWILARILHSCQWSRLQKRVHFFQIYAWNTAQNIFSACFYVKQCNASHLWPFF